MRIDWQSAAFCCANQQRAHKSFGASLRARREHVTALGVEGRSTSYHLDKYQYLPK